MSSSLGAWGVPDFGSVLCRDRVSELILACGTRPAILHGPSGCGKSIAAANYVTRLVKAVVWIDACGEFLAADQIATRVYGALVPSSAGVESPVGELSGTISTEALLSALEVHSGGRGFCLVIDDQGTPPDDDAAKALSRLARLVRSAASQVLITSRCSVGWPSETLCDWEPIGATELALDAADAKAILQRLGLSMVAEQADALLATCQGHPAIFAVMASQAARFGVDVESTRSTSLDAWLDRLVTVQMSPECRRALCLASLVKSGDERDLEKLGVSQAGHMLAEMAAALPLVSSSVGVGGARSFRTHDLVDGFLLDRRVAVEFCLADESYSTAVEILSKRGDYFRASKLLSRCLAAEGLADWIESYGRQALSAGVFEQLRRLFESIPVHQLVGRPRVLLLWAELCDETGDFGEALAKCQASRSLAEHEGDAETSTRAALLTLRCLCRCHRLDEAELLATELLASPLIASHPGLHAQALLCVGQARLTRGDNPRDALEVLEAASKVSEGIPASSSTRCTAINLSAIVLVLAEGDWMAAAQRVSRLAAVPSQSVSSAIIAKGNLGLMLVEVGRLERARSMLRRALQDAESYGLDIYAGAYMPPLGWLMVAAGEVDEGIAMIGRGIAQSEASGENEEVQLDRVYLSTVLRAASRPDESLTEAERAFEQLSVADNMGFRRLAALEVAASLLALGDLSAARAWTESIASEGPPPNRYHHLRADMILAEVERREGRLEAAVKRLALHESYVRSENANWQIAMYCRAFPELLGVFALSVGPESLPTHMLRMIMPEHAEVAMTRSKTFMDDAPWRALGVRLLGEEEFARFIARDGLPLCHVRMFGGLEVNIGGRSVRERDWKKRKARLLFSMLIIRRGQDVSRDQLLEHLWPGMDEPRAKSNLYVIWSAMKSVLLGEDAAKALKCPYVESVGGVCRSVRDAVRTDVDAFELACARAREAEANGLPADALQAYRQMSDLYRGDLLPGDCYEDWFANLREHYRAEFIDAMRRATELLLDAHDPHTALIFVRRAIQHDQFREDLYQAALRCQIAAGQRSSAIDTYMQCRDKLCEELGLDPSAEMRALYGEILAMEDRSQPVDFDPLAD